jgi:hypothetical protein
VFASVKEARRRGASSSAFGIADATLLTSTDGAVRILDVFNAGATMRSIPIEAVRGAFDTDPRVRDFHVRPGESIDFLFDVPLHELDQRFGIGDRIEYSNCPITPSDDDRGIVIAPFASGSTCDYRIRVAGHVLVSDFKTALGLGFPYMRISFDGRLSKGGNGDVSLTRTPGANPPVDTARAVVRTEDPFRDGEDSLVITNGILHVVVSPFAGARIFVFSPELGRHVERDPTHVRMNEVTTIGDFRDGVQSPPTASPRDYIAAYTHPMDAGTFNRQYACNIASASGKYAEVRCTYDAPDLAATPVHFEKTFRLEVGSRTLEVTMRSSAPATSISAILDGPGATFDVPATDVVTNDVRSGYRIETVAYPANTPTTLKLTLKDESAPQ